MYNRHSLALYTLHPIQPEYSPALRKPLAFPYLTPEKRGTETLTSKANATQQPILESAENLSGAPELSFLPPGSGWAEK